MSNGAFKSMQRFIPDAKNLASTLNWYPLSVSCLDTYMKHRGEGAIIESYGAGKLCSWEMHSRG
ncbi:unnamed protein product [Larinioides sclopetarius]|uniref:Uncharacterized protein n=1 Tax=Larinioides sclopetarius TaxID=280406 RepID=A0AAV2A813_9ARAC